MVRMCLRVVWYPLPSDRWTPDHSSGCSWNHYLKKKKYFAETGPKDSGSPHNVVNFMSFACGLCVLLLLKTVSFTFLAFQRLWLSVKKKTCSLNKFNLIASHGFENWSFTLLRVVCVWFLLLNIFSIFMLMSCHHLSPRLQFFLWQYLSLNVDYFG